MVIIRFWRVLLLSLFSKKGLREGYQLNFLCTPFDIDINLHMNNSIYLRMMDFGRWDFILKSGMLAVFLKNNLRPVASEVKIRFRKPVPPFARIAMDTRIVRLEEKRFVFEQTFFRHRDGAIYARAEVTGAVLRNKETLPTAELLKFLEGDWRPSPSFVP